MASQEGERRESENESCSVMSDSLQPHGLYSPWNSPGHNAGVGSHSLLQGIFPTQGSNPGLLHYRQILYTREAQEHWSGQPIPSPEDLPDPGTEPGSPALKACSLPVELPGNPQEDKKMTSTVITGHRRPGRPNFFFNKLMSLQHYLQQPRHRKNLNAHGQKNG